MTAIPPITKEERENALDWTRIKLTSGNVSQSYYSNTVKAYEAALAATEARLLELTEAREQWRQDAAARLLTYVALIDKNIIGDAAQVRVSLIMPTLAMLKNDETGEYDEAKPINVSSAIARAACALRAAYGESE